VLDELNRTAPRRMGVLRPLKVVLTNYPEGQVEVFPAVNNPEDPAAGTRPVPFSRVLYIEREDFMEDPPKKFYRLSPGREVRLRYAYLITCQEAVTDASGEILELRCTYDPATRGGSAPDGRSPKATLHWVSAAHAQAAEVRLYDHLFTVPEPDAEGDLLAHLNPGSEQVLTGCQLEPGLDKMSAGERLHGRGHPPAAAGAQPGGDAAGYLGEGAGPGEIGPGRSPRRAPPSDASWAPARAGCCSAAAVGRWCAA
jgi:glutaminyl-tRNA synthetase